MSYPINYPTPQNANVQTFTDPSVAASWVKPQGATMVWFTLIGGGGNGNGYNSGASGSVTNFMVPAFFIPDILKIKVGGYIGVYNNTTVSYQQKDGIGYTLLTAETGTATPSTQNSFTAAGIYQSVAGAYNSIGNLTMFLTAGDVTANCYGYTTSGNGYFQMQPIINGIGSYGSGNAGIGCGGSFTNGSKGGQGMVVIISW